MQKKQYMQETNVMYLYL